MRCDKEDDTVYRERSEGLMINKWTMKKKGRSLKQGRGVRT